jgi:hypothetical protein
LPNWCCHQRHAVQTVAQFLDEMHVGHRRPVAVGRVHFQGSRVRSASEANIIDVALAGQKIGFLAGFGGADAARHSVIAWQLQTNRSNELDWPTHTDAPKQVVVVSAGIEGMEAAWVAAARGHDVTVCGASDVIGGKGWLREKLPGGRYPRSMTTRPSRRAVPGRTSSSAGGPRRQISSRFDVTW